MRPLIGKVVLAAAFLVLAAVVAAQLGHPWWKWPKRVSGPHASIKIAESLDFGVIAKEGLATKSTDVANVGQAPLEIIGIRASCGCTKPQMASKTIAPGEKSELLVSMNPRKINGFDTRQAVTINSTDPEKKWVSLPVLARVDPEFSVDPPSLDFGPIEKGDTVERTIVLRQLGAEKIEVTDVKTAVESVGVGLTFEKRPEAEWKAAGMPEYAIKVSLTAEAPAGILNAPLDIMTTCARMPAFRYTLKGTVKAPFTVTPQKFHAGTVTPGQEAVTKIKISGDGELEITDLAVTGNVFSVALEDTKTREKSVSVSVAAQVDAGLKKEYITFKVKTAGKVYPVKIPIDARI